MFIIIFVNFLSSESNLHQIYRNLHFIGHFFFIELKLRLKQTETSKLKRQTENKIILQTAIAFLSIAAMAYEQYSSYY